MRKFVCAATVMLVAIGIVVAEDFNVTIKKVDGDKVTFAKKVKKGETAKDETLSATASAKVAKGKFTKGQPPEVGDAIESGLKNEMFSDGKIGTGVGALITVEDGKITRILVKGKKKAAGG